MSYNDYYGQSFNAPYSSGFDQSSTYGYPDPYLSTSSSSYSSVPMQQSNSGSSIGSRGSHTSYNSFHSHNSHFTHPSSPEEYIYDTQTISPTATHAVPQIDFHHAPSVNTSKKGAHKSLTSTSNSNSKSGVLHCLHKHCEYQTKRQYDLDRHLKTHFPKLQEKHDCPGRGCGRTGEHGFDRKDHLREHLRKVHAKDIPKLNRRNSKVPGQ